MSTSARIELSPTTTIVVDVPDGATIMERQKAVIEACAFWQQLPTACPMSGCGAPLTFFARHPQNFHYFGLVCQGAKPHEMNFGERKDGTTLYLKDDGWRDAYQGAQTDEPAAAQSSAPASAPAPASPTGDKVDAQTIRMITAVANGKTPKPDVDSIASQFFGGKLAELSKTDAMNVLEYIKTL